MDRGNGERNTASWLPIPLIGQYLCWRESGLWTYSVTPIRLKPTAAPVPTNTLHPTYTPNAKGDNLGPGYVETIIREDGAILRSRPNDEPGYSVSWPNPYPKMYGHMPEALRLYNAGEMTLAEATLLASLRADPENGTIVVDVFGDDREALEAALIRHGH